MNKKWTIHKDFDFCYGHRVWNQTLNSKYSLDSCLKCRHLHGHQGKISVHLSVEGTLNDGMVTDFKHLNWFKKWLDDVLDHKFIMDVKDPLRGQIFPLVRDLSKNQSLTEKLFDVQEMGNNEYYTVKPKIYLEEPNYIKELYEGVVFVPFVPTSENLTAWLFHLIEEKMSKFGEQGVKVEKVTFDETPKSHSQFEYTN